MPNKFKLNAPILFLAFNRQETTRRVFEAIREAKPARLYVAADGPRPERQGEEALCAETRSLATAVDWPCEVKTLFRERNLGCREAVSSAITWFFENEPEGIILEDDCLPSQDFFRFCSELLDRYRDDERVMHIGGANFQFGIKRGDGSYYFSKVAHIWGWASWRRAWRHYDVDMKSLPAFRDSGCFKDIFQTKAQAVTWRKIMQGVYDKKPWFNTWDHQWTYALFKEGGLSIIPNVNLVSNIGFKTGGAHTKPGAKSVFDAIPCEKLEEELRHPRFMVPSVAADLDSFKRFFYESPLKRALRKSKELANRFAGADRA